MLLDVEACGSSICDNEGRTPVMVCLELNRVDVLKVFMDKHHTQNKKKGTGVGKPDKDGFIPLMIACMRNQTEAVRILSFEPSHLRFHDRERRTALMIASQYSTPEIVQILLDNRASIFPKNITNIPLFIACQRGDLEVVKVLVNKHVSINRFLEFKQKAIQTCLDHNHHHVADFLRSFIPPPYRRRVLRFSPAMKNRWKKPKGPKDQDDGDGFDQDEKKNFHDDNHNEDETEYEDENDDDDEEGDDEDEEENDEEDDDDEDEEENDEEDEERFDDGNEDENEEE